MIPRPPAAPRIDRTRRPVLRGASSAVDVSVVVVSWNTRAHLRACLASVFRETRDVSFEVVVVDNASADGSAAMVRAEFPSATLVANAENRGFAAANNQAFRLARGRYVLLLNPDVVVLDGAIGAAVRAADADRTIGALGCQVLARAGEVQQTCFRFPSAFGLFLLATGLHRILPKSWFGGGPQMRSFDRRSARDVDVVSGMFLLARREAVESVGPMDESYFVYAEEADWCFRMRRAGWRCKFTPAARVLHADGGGKSTAQADVQMHVQLQKSLLTFLRKNRGRASFFAAKAVLLAAASIRWCVWGPAAVAGGPARRKARRAAAALRFHLTGRMPVR